MKVYSINTGFFKLDGGAMFGVKPPKSPDGGLWNIHLICTLFQ